MEILNNDTFETLYTKAMSIADMLKIDRPTGTQVLEGLLAACTDAGKKGSLGIGIVKDAWPNKIVAAADIRGNVIQLVVMSHSNSDTPIDTKDSFKVDAPKAEPLLKDLPVIESKEREL